MGGPDNSAGPRLRPAGLFAADLRSIALSRIALGLVLLADALLRLRDLSAFYGDRGVLPRQALFEISTNRWRVSLFAISGHEAVLLVLFGILILAAIGIVLGYRTRLSTVIAWLLVISLHNRNPMILTGADTVLRLTLFWGMFAPWGAYWSLDRWLQPDRGLTRPASEAGFRVLTWGSAALLLQPILVHLFAGLLKTDVHWRGFGHMSLAWQPESFSALYYVLEADQFSLPFGRLLRQLPFEVLQGLTAVTMAIELLAPLALLVTAWSGRVRLVGFLALCAIHVGLIFVMQLGIFPWVNLATLLVFLPAIAWRRLGAVERALDRWLSGLAARTPARLAARVPAYRGLRMAGWQKITVAAAMLVVLLWNVDTLPRAAFPTESREWAADLGLPARLVPAPVRPAVYLLRLDQRWNLFAPKPLRDDGWYVIPGTLRDGSEVDVYRNGAAVSWEKPQNISAEFKNYRWRKYSRNLWLRHNQEHRLWYGKWLCRTWNTRHRGGAILESFDIYFMREDTELPGESSPPRKVDLWHHECFARE